MCYVTSPSLIILKLTSLPLRGLRACERPLHRLQAPGNAGPRKELKAGLWGERDRGEGEEEGQEGLAFPKLALGQGHWSVA